MNNNYIIDFENIISDFMDDEMVVINLDTGCYYNLNQTAAAIFSFFKQVNTLENAVTLYKKMYDLENDIARKDVSEMMAYFIKKNFLLKSLDTCQTMTPVAAGAYVSPVVEEFSDMQEMLLLDPIHEVKEEGWPYKKDE